MTVLNNIRCHHKGNNKENICLSDTYYNISIKLLEIFEEKEKFPKKGTILQLKIIRIYGKVFTFLDFN